MGIPEIIADKKEQILELAAVHGASNVRVFGSVANGTADQDSDIDFLVNMEKGRSLMALSCIFRFLRILKPAARPFNLF